MQPNILGYFSPTITMEICTFHFKTSMIQGGYFFKMFDYFLYGLWKGSGGYWYNHGMWYINLVCFFSTKTMRITKNPFWASCGWENTTPSTELPRDFCAGIGPLQLGVVLVLFLSKSKLVYPLQVFLNYIWLLTLFQLLTRCVRWQTCVIWSQTFSDQM